MGVSGEPRRGDNKGEISESGIFELMQGILCPGWAVESSAGTVSTHPPPEALRSLLRGYSGLHTQILSMMGHHPTSPVLGAENPPGILTVKMMREEDLTSRGLQLDSGQRRASQCPKSVEDSRGKFFCGKSEGFYEMKGQLGSMP